MRDESGWRSVSWVLRVAMKRELGSGTGTGDCASWSDDARVADCGDKDRGNLGMGQGGGPRAATWKAATMGRPLRAARTGGK